jgi:hypothetical protein
METPGTGANDDPQPPRSTGAHRAARPAFARWRGPVAALAILAVAAAAVLIVQFGHGAGSADAGAASASPYPRTGSTASDSAHGASPTGSGGHARPSGTATPIASRSTPAHASSQKPATPTASSRKGVSVWSFNGVDAALSQSGAGWYYTWSAGHAGITTPHGVDFVPMIWGSGSVTTQSIAQAKSAGHYLLGFNEPDLSSQSNMSVSQALDLWPKLQATGQTLGSPAVAAGGATPGGWLDQFMSGAKSRGYRVDFIALHWYGRDFTTSAAVSQLKSYLQAVWNRYHKPIWLTEYALINFSNGTHYPSESEQAAFVTASTKMLDNLSYLQRYAWFALPAADDGPSTGLFTSGPKVTDVGRAFESAH